ncbi:hypothetical protein PAXRUDRAFT_833897 [Paxillus rubicundulus Ve08.2h10]|uniref:Uncharacterized protein n=1 Tax=Paxillus rubicundulus Ve08.2h10 TaxID=930991 RepID=A0A0D0DFJ0_9AGAM|nr:hypothetical protein PAXRUDRAFT_833897 [Paxillus rubicundulus Ve08.2h10]
MRRGTLVTIHTANRAQALVKKNIPKRAAQDESTDHSYRALMVSIIANKKLVTGHTMKPGSHSPPSQRQLSDAHLS